MSDRERDDIEEASETEEAAEAADAPETDDAVDDETSTGDDEPASEPPPRKKRRREKGAGAAEAAPAPADAPAPAGPSPLLVGVIALVLGLAGGWLLRGTSTAEGRPAPVASASATASPASDSCASWSTQLCEKVGPQTEACAQAQQAKAILPSGACAAALTDLPASIALAKKLGEVCEELVAKLCKDLGPETQTCAMVKERTPTFPSGQCREMLEGYDRVVQELREVEKQNAPLTPELAKKHATGDRPSFGPDDAKVTVVEYSDFECPYCGQAATVVTALKERFGDRVRFVFRQFPLSFHPNADLAAQASLAAHAQGKFWPFHDLLFQNQDALDRASLEGYAEKAGLDVAAFKKALDDETYAKAVKEDLALGEEVGVSGTPSMMVNTVRVSNPTDVDAVAALIEKELAAGG